MKELEESQSAVIAVEVEPERPKRKRKPREKEKTENRREPNYHVIIWNDDDHTQEYVVVLLMELFGHSEEAAFEIMKEVHEQGKGIAATYHKELAELKRDQIIGYRQDWLADKPLGPLHTTIEPAPE